MARTDYAAIFPARPFWILISVVLFCNLPHTIFLFQLKNLLLARGVDGHAAGIMFTTLSIGMLSGRLLTGLALDRLNPTLVGFVTLALPALGMFLFASDSQAAPVLSLAVFCLGFAVGSEGDVLSFLVGRYFAIELYGSVLGLLTGAISVAATLSAVLLSITMAATGGFSLFLTIVGTAVLIGASLLLLLRHNQPVAASTCRAEAAVAAFSGIEPAQDACAHALFKAARSRYQRR